MHITFKNNLTLQYLSNNVLCNEAQLSVLRSEYMLSVRETGHGVHLKFAIEIPDTNAVNVNPMGPHVHCWHNDVIKGPSSGNYHKSLRYMGSSWHAKQVVIGYMQSPANICPRAIGTGELHRRESSVDVFDIVVGVEVEDDERFKGKHRDTYASGAMANSKGICNAPNEVEYPHKVALVTNCRWSIDEKSQVKDD